MKSLKVWGRVLSALETNPLHRFTPAFICGLAFLIGYYFKFYAAILSALLFISLIGISVIKKGKSTRYLTIYLMFTLFVFTGSLTRKVYLPDRQYIKLAKFWDKKGIIWEGMILPFADVYPDRIRFTVEVRRVFAQDKIYKINEKIILTVMNSASEWLPGDIFIARATIKKPRNFNNPGRFDYVMYLARRKIFGTAYLKNDLFMAKTLGSGNNSLLLSIIRVLERQRRKISQCILEATRKNRDSESANGILQAMLLGYKHFLQQPFTDQISFAGVRHIVAISGLHFGCVAGIIFLVMKLIIKRLAPATGLYIPIRTAAAILSLPLLTCYALITGLAAPSFRAFTFIILTLFVFAFYRNIDKSTILIITACLIILINPHEAYSPSFILSFTAVAAIIYVAIPLKQSQEREHKYTSTGAVIVRSIGWIIWISFVVQVSLLAVCFHFFHRFSLTGFISNPIIVPFVTVIILPLGLTFMAITLLSKSTAISFYALFCSKVVDFLVYLIKLSGGFSHPIIWSPQVSGMLAAAYTGLFILSGIYLKQSSSLKKIMLLSLFPAVFMGVLKVKQLTFSTESNWLYVTVLDVSQGSSTFLKLPDGQTFLIDGGGFRYSKFDLGKNVLIPFLASQNITHVDYVVLSHYHPDHAKGLLFLARYYPVSQFWETGCYNRRLNFPNLARIFEARHVKTYSVKELRRNQTFGNVHLEILNPRPEEIPGVCRDLNKSSIVLQFIYGKTAIIIPSDVDRETLSRLDFRQRNSIQTVLVAPHHGSKYSFDPLIFEKINPCMVVISCGYKNPYGIPYSGLLKWCRKRNIPVIRTDMDGAILLKTNGRRWLFDTFGTNHHWRKTECGTIFSATYTETSRHWKSVCNTLKN